MPCTTLATSSFVALLDLTSVILLSVGSSSFIRTYVAHVSSLFSFTLAKLASFYNLASTMFKMLLSSLVNS